MNQDLDKSLIELQVLRKKLWTSKLKDLPKFIPPPYEIYLGAKEGFRRSIRVITTNYSLRYVDDNAYSCTKRYFPLSDNVGFRDQDNYKFFISCNSLEEFEEFIYINLLTK